MMSENGFRPELVDLSNDAYVEVLKKLFERGHFGDKTWDEVLDEQPPAVAIFGRRRCALGDFASAGTCKWPMLDVTYSPRIVLPGLSAAQILQAFQTAAQSWNAVCGIRLALTQNYDAANIYSHDGKIDGKSGTLAYSYLPCGSSKASRMEQVYDSAEAWSYNWLVEVAAHEIGHAIGLSHGPQGSLMYAYSAGGRLAGPQTWDINEARNRYGAPTAPPPPTDPPLTPAVRNVSGVLVIDGKVFKLTAESAT